MLQQIMTAPGVIEIVQTDTPKPEPRQVLVKIKRIGICGSDVHVYHGKHPFTKYPITQGHEVCGEIVELGSGVSDLKIGQKVTIEPQVFCGECYSCKNGKYNLCESLKVMGFQTTGAASEYFVVNVEKITLLPDTMSFDEGAMIEPLAVTVHAANRYGDMKGARVAILGCGPIGILLAQTCKAFGAEKVIITDISDRRLEIASSCGIESTVNTLSNDFGETMLRIFGPDKADVIFDCAGTNTTMAQAISTSRKGSKIILVAVFAGMASIDLATLNDKELDLDTTMMYRHEDYLAAIKLLVEKRVSLLPLITTHIPFNKYKDAYEYIENNKESTMKVIIDIE